MWRRMIAHIPQFGSYTRAMFSSQIQSYSSAVADADADVIQRKRVLRSKVRKALKDLQPDHRHQQDETIQSLVLEAPWFNSSRRLCAYVSCDALKEVNTSSILSHILQEKHMSKKLYVPRVEDKQRNMKMLHINTISDLIANSMNILEPSVVDVTGNKREDVLEAEEPLDLLLLPGLAFNRTGRRLGRGGGYYDHFLQSYLDLAVKKDWKPPLLVGLAYKEQILEEEIPVLPHDISVDALVSSSGILPISSYATSIMQGQS